MINNIQDSRLSSSRRQTPPPPPPPEKQTHANAVGCMSGIFKLISKYQNRKKLLTFGKKKGITITTKTANVKVKEEENGLYMDKIMEPRSSMLSPKLHKPKPEKVAEAASKPLASMAVKEEGEDPVGEKEESSEKKRQKLLEALEKCNEDLEALKMIIKAVHSNENQVRSLAVAAPPPCRVDSVGGDGSRAEEKCMKTCEDEKNEKVRVELLNNSSFIYNSKCHGKGEENIERNNKSQSKTKQEKHNKVGNRCFSKFVKEPYGKQRKPILFTTFCASNAMIQSVEEVCNDIIYGEKREVANIGIMLHNHICKDLIEEIIQDLGYHKMYRFPLHGCKRRLSF